MKALVTVVGVLSLALAARADAQDRPKKPQVRTLSIEAEELAREFAADAKTAAKKYVADPKDVAAGKVTGAPLLSPIHGVVEQFGGKDVVLQTGNKVKVVLRTKEAVSALTGVQKHYATSAGYVTRYDPKTHTVVVACDKVTVGAATGKKK